MKPREIALSVILVLVLLVAASPSAGQQPAKVYRIGYIAPAAPPERLREAFVEGLRERGYVEGQNLVFERRYTDGQDKRAPSLAAELVSLKVDLIVAQGTAQVRAAKQTTSEIPIVMVGVIEPVRRRLVASLAHPGGNVTGLTETVGVKIVGKCLQLLKEAVPKASRVAVLGYSGAASDRVIFQSEMEAAARALDVSLQLYEVGAPEGFEGAFTAMTKGQADALLVRPHFLFATHAERIVGLAAKNRLPAIYPFRGAVEAGGLMSYAVNEPDVFRRIGFYVDKILKGAKPDDLPVEQPTKFELLINLKTAKGLGLTISHSLLGRADEVIR
jgi:putative ABC transport system substrate-binding protein